MKGTVAHGVLSVVGRAQRGRPAAAPEPVDHAALLGALPVPIVVLNAANRFTYVNHAAEQFLGLSCPHLLQMTLADLVAVDNPLFLLLDQVRRGEVTVSDHDLAIEGPRLRKTGIAVQGTPLADEPGVVLLSLQDASTARTLDRQTAFRGAARSVSGLAAMLAHEVKNPLSGIRGAAQLLETTVASSDRELTVLIRDEADRIRALVDRMEVFGDKPIERQAVNIHRVLDHVRRIAETGFAAHLRFTEAYDPSLPPVYGNRDQLIQVVLNLVKNAAEALTDSATPFGEITLITRYQHGMRVAVAGSARAVHLPLVVVVRDNGPGITEELRPHLFEPFVTSKRSGTGLGLSLVAKLIGDQGGLIEVDCQPGRTEFRLYLPMLAAEAGDDAA